MPNKKKISGNKPVVMRTYHITTRISTHLAYNNWFQENIPYDQI